MPAALLPWPLAKFFQTNTNLPLAGGKVYTYIAGTSTPLATYPTPAATPGTENTNPIILDANGEAAIYLTDGSSYKINVTTSTDVQIPNYPIDNVTSATFAADLLRADLASSNSSKGVSLVYGAGRVIDSITALRAVNKLTNSRVFVTGYYAVGDGGGGHYWYDSTDTTSADNGGTIIVATDGGRWKLIHNYKLYAEQFGAVGDGTTNDYTALFNADAYLTATGGEILGTPGKVYGIGTTLVVHRGVSLIGTHSGSHYDETDNKDICTIKAIAGLASTVLTFQNRWSSRFEGWVVDCGTICANGVQQIAPQKSVNRNIVVKDTLANGGGSGWSITTDGATYPDGTTQYPSAGLNIYEQIIVRDMGIGVVALYMDGTIGPPSASVTENEFRTCKFHGGTGSKSLVMNSKCDTNNFFACAFDGPVQNPVGPVNGYAVYINAGTDTEVYSNNFFGCWIVNLDANATGIYSQYNAANNVFTGCYLPQQGTVTTLGTQGKVKTVDCLYGGSRNYEVPSSPAIGASPYTYTNTNTYPVTFTVFGGTITGVTKNRSGSTYGISSTQTQYSEYLEPGDGMTITYSAGTPTLQVFPHS